MLNIDEDAHGLVGAYIIKRFDHIYSLENDVVFSPGSGKVRTTDFKLIKRNGEIAHFNIYEVGPVTIANAVVVDTENEDVIYPFKDYALYPQVSEVYCVLPYVDFKHVTVIAYEPHMMARGFHYIFGDEILQEVGGFIK